MPNSLMSSGSENMAEDANAQSWSLLNEYEFFPSLPSSYDAEQTQTHDESAASLHYSSLYRELGIDIHIETPHLLHDAFPKAGAEFPSPETAASDVYAPVSGTVVEVNDALGDKPETINEDAFGEGWLFTLQMDEPGQVNELLDPDGYAELLEDEDH